MKRLIPFVLLATGCWDGVEPFPELSGVWFDTLVVNGSRYEWVLALEEFDGDIVGRYRLLDLSDSFFPVEGDVEGRYGHPDVTMELTVYRKNALICSFEGAVSRDFEVLDGLLFCHTDAGEPAYIAPMYFEKLKGMDDGRR